MKQTTQEIIAVLYNIRSVHNVGAFFRTADAAGISKLYLCGTTPNPLDRFGNLRKDFAKVALGAECGVKWDVVSGRGTLACIDRLKKAGWAICAVEQDPASIFYYELPKRFLSREKLCLVVGNEVRGLPSSVLKRADAILEIPMRGIKESLNVSVAFGIVAFRMRYP